MKKTAVLIAISGFLLSPTVVSAEVNVNVSGNNASSNVSVHQEGSSQVTTCTNGHCETTGSTGKTTVCTNGDCKTSDNGNYKYESSDGTTQIHVNTDTTVTKKEDMTVGPTDVDVPELTITPNPTISQKIKEAHTQIKAAKEKVAEKKSEFKKRLKDHDAGLSSFLQSEMDSLQKMFDTFFK